MITDQTFWELTRKHVLSEDEKQLMHAYQHGYKQERLNVIEQQHIKAILPNGKIGSSWAMGHPYATHTFGRLTGMLGQSDLVGSDYDYPLTKDTRLIHYTSLEVLAMILNEGAFGAFSLSNSNDQQEFICKASEMGCADWNLKKWRANLFSARSSTLQSMASPTPRVMSCRGGQAPQSVNYCTDCARDGHLHLTVPGDTSRLYV